MPVVEIEECERHGDEHASTPKLRRTRDAVAHLLAQRGPSTVPRLAAELGLTVPAVRRHIEALERDGLVMAVGVGERRVDEQGHAQRGRPARHYQLVPAARPAGAGYELLARTAVRFLADAGEIDRFAARWAEEACDSMMTRLDVSAGRAGTAVVADLLDAGGYAASVDADGHLCQHNCPVVDLAREFPQLCEAETAAVGRLLGAPVRRLQTIASGASSCVTEVGRVTEISRVTEVPASPAAEQKNSDSRVSAGSFPGPRTLFQKQPAPLEETAL